VRRTRLDVMRGSGRCASSRGHRRDVMYSSTFSCSNSKLDSLFESGLAACSIAPGFWLHESIVNPYPTSTSKCQEICHQTHYHPTQIHPAIAPHYLRCTRASPLRPVPVLPLADRVTNVVFSHPSARIAWASESQQPCRTSGAKLLNFRAATGGLTHAPITSSLPTSHHMDHAMLQHPQHRMGHTMLSPPWRDLHQAR
jgi:hypothetical protein